MSFARLTQISPLCNMKRALTHIEHDTERTRIFDACHCLGEIISVSCFVRRRRHVTSLTNLDVFVAAVQWSHLCKSNLFFDVPGDICMLNCRARNKTINQDGLLL